MTELSVEGELFGCSAGSVVSTVRCMAEEFTGDRDLSLLIVPRVGMVEVRADLWEPVRLLDPVGDLVVPVAAFLNELQAAGRSAATQRSYVMDLLRWFRFGWAIDVGWDQATRVEASGVSHKFLMRSVGHWGHAESGEGVDGL